MADYRTRRRQELEHMNRQAQIKQEEQRRQEGYYEDSWTPPNNTLGPNEDVVEKRRYHTHVFPTTGNGRPNNTLAENVGLLLLLILFIVGLYQLCIYILNQ